jgi:predicted MFS family arabinose efflux permease
MFNKFADRIRNSDIDYRLLVPLLVSTALVQMCTALIRVTTSYRAIELDLSIVWLGVIAAAFALFPILVAVRVVRFIDRGHDAHTAWIGAAGFLLGCVGFVLWPSPQGLLVATMVMGAGHLCLMASQQMLCVRAAGRGSLEPVFGNYMVAGAIGQGAGPYIVGWAGGSATLPPTQFLFTVGLIIAAVSLAVILTMRPAKTKPQLGLEGEVASIGSLLRVPGLTAVVTAGVILVAGSDIVIIYIPLLGAERSIDVKDIGLLLTLRAVASMIARLFYSRLVEATGRWPLMIASAFACACSYAALAAPLPFWAMALSMAVMGFSFGLATTLSIVIVVDMTAAGARGTANSLRIMANRLGQFVLPFGAGLVAAAAGIPGLLLVCAGALGAAAGAMHWRRPKR